jgi:hypothetical protein
MLSVSTLLWPTPLYKMLAVLVTERNYGQMRAADRHNCLLKEQSSGCQVWASFHLLLVGFPEHIYYSLSVNGECSIT